MIGKIDLNDLVAFAAVVDAGTFSGAAQRLRMPTSSVSRAVVRLEAAMGARVLHRTTRRVAPSTAGQALYAKVRGDLASLERAVGDLRELDEEPSGTLRLTAASAFGPFLGGVVARFVTRYRDVDVEVRLTNEFVDLVAGGFDLALRYATRRLKSSSLTARKIAPSSMHLFASPAYLARSGTPRTPRDLADHDWVCFVRKRELLLEGGGTSTIVTPRGRVASDDLAFARAAVVEGCGIGYLPKAFATDEVATGKLVRVLPKWFCVDASLWALWPGERRPPRKVAAFLEMLDEAVRGAGFT
jgi:DNA-binding transcriptional LysR family regulator